jgi:hypothetical protein
MDGGTGLVYACGDNGGPVLGLSGSISKLQCSQLAATSATPCAICACVAKPGSLKCCSCVTEALQHLQFTYDTLWHCHCCFFSYLLRGFAAM